ncbi:hydrogenase expression/formation protein HypC [Solimonas aquatica]|uniref:Hydrogenase expression/formation protein HypC n=1 Tax=Solimonas aquatica TaxID=489703 RepID=A0A1H9FYX3_9GAMM|nr:HypC/HybG/HupF family hydrogenase formation chaperone [Solimonas aquatica]SEQ42823.1 hydrogenase expression/formation protein HypC [Solimonas aquatica]
MCVGIPMRVLSSADGMAECEGRGERRRVRMALVGEVPVGEQVLVFLDSAIERLDAARAAEIEAALDLLQAALHGEHSSAAPPFSLPSAMDAGSLAALTGAAESAKH